MYSVVSVGLTARSPAGSTLPMLGSIDTLVVSLAPSTFQRNLDGCPDATVVGSVSNWVIEAGVTWIQVVSCWLPAALNKVSVYSISPEPPGRTIVGEPAVTSSSGLPGTTSPLFEVMV